MKSISTIDRRRGAVSIFVVVFSALLITVVTISFIRIMVNDQDQASRNDLSQSAYDSAQAGVEDAKRALLRYYAACSATGNATECARAREAVSSTTCNEMVRYGNVIGEDSEGETGPDGDAQYGEIKVQQRSNPGDEQLDQAYTCVTAQLVTDDYLSSDPNPANTSTLVPLKVQAGRTFNTVTIEWFSADDMEGANTNGRVDLRSNVETPMPLLAQDKWPVTRPALMRAQFMQVGSNFTLNDFNAPADGESNANTVFLYPTSSDAAPHAVEILGRDARKDNGTALKAEPYNAPLPVRCQDVDTPRYSCKMSLTIPAPIGGGDRQAFLLLTPLYNKSQFRVTLSDGMTPQQFDGVQPIIDSTGRANDMFRRVSSRVTLSDFPYPEGAVDVMGNFCKSFSVTDTKYYPGSGDFSCTP